VRAPTRRNASLMWRTPARSARSRENRMARTTWRLRSEIASITARGAPAFEACEADLDGGDDL
jgi:hypothetical protein